MLQKIRFPSFKFNNLTGQTHKVFCVSFVYAQLLLICKINFLIRTMNLMGQQIQCTVAYLCSKNIQGKPIEAADNRLLNIQPEVVHGPQSRQQKPWFAATEHVDVYSSPFSQPDLNLSIVLHRASDSKSLILNRTMYLKIQEVIFNLIQILTEYK